MSQLYITNWKGDFKEKKVHSTPEIYGDFYLHVRVGESFKFKDYLKVKLVPAHWLKIEPIKMGDKSEHLFMTILVRLTSKSFFLGLASEKSSLFSKKPTFEFPGFNKVTDLINTKLMQQIFDTGLSIKEFKTLFIDFAANKAKDHDDHREFIKIKYGHNASEGCDKNVRGISVTINPSYEIEENCGH